MPLLYNDKDIRTAISILKGTDRCIWKVNKVYPKTVTCKKNRWNKAFAQHILLRDACSVYFLDMEKLGATMFTCELFKFPVNPWKSLRLLCKTLV